ncbi:hypothetical protein Hanom_Chr04g00302871 [Helianthus anomalus]
MFMVFITKDKSSWSYQWNIECFLTTFWVLYMCLSLTLPHLERVRVFQGLLPTFTLIPSYLAKPLPSFAAKPHQWRNRDN